MILVLIFYLFVSVLILIVFYLAATTLILLFIKLWLEPIKGACTSNIRLDNKVALVTGGNTGIGLETARDLASRGARVVIACRDGKKAADAIADIKNTTGNNNIEYKYLDLASFKSIRKFAEEFKNSFECLDILINNAGCGGLKNETTKDDINKVMQVNYFGHFLLTNLLLDRITTSRSGRIIIVSSILHHIGFISVNKLTGVNAILPVINYCNGKLCQVLWTKALAKRLPSNVTVNSLHPGVVKTNIFNIINPILLSWFLMLLNVLNFKTPKEGAQTTIYLAVSEEVAGVSGKYFVDCKEAKYSRIADNDDIVEKIWNKSVMLTSQ